MKRRISSIAGPILGLLVLVTVVPLSTACEGFELDWVAVEDSVTLYSLARPEYADLPAAYDFIARTRLVIDRPIAGDPYVFDLVVSEQDGEMVLLPAGVFETFPIDPGIAIDSSGTTFEDLAEAPREGYISDRAVPVRTDVVYTIRTRRDGSGCRRYGKFEIVEVDPPLGILTFRQIRNQLCNDRELIAPIQPEDL